MWCSKTLNVDIKGFNHFNSPRPKLNSKAKTHTGGLNVYYKEHLNNKIELVKVDHRGYIWFKLCKKDFGFENDRYFCLIFMPPENSTLYKNRQSGLFEYDLLTLINDDVIY